MTRDDSKAHTCESILGNKEANLLNQILLCAGRSSLPQTPPAFLSLTYQETQVINKFSCYGSCFLLPLEWSMLFDMAPTALLPPATLALGAACQGHLPASGPDSVSACSRAPHSAHANHPLAGQASASQGDPSSTDLLALSVWIPPVALVSGLLPPLFLWLRCPLVCLGTAEGASLRVRCKPRAVSWRRSPLHALGSSTLQCAGLYWVKRAEEKTSARAASAVPVIDTIRCSLLCHILLPKVDFSCGQRVSVYPAWLKNWAKRTLSLITDNYTLSLWFGFSNCL